MANVKFFRKDVAPSNPQEGYVWFNSSNNTIQLYKNSAWEVYTGKINDVTYADGKLTIIPHVGDSTTIDLSAIADISDLSTRLGTLETNFNTLSGEFATEKGKISTLQGEMTTVKTEVAKLSDITGKVGAYVVEQFRLHDEARAEIDGGFESRISTLETGHTTLDGKIDGVQSTLQGAIDTEKGRVDKLVGSDANKSVRTIANEELAAQLLAGPDGAVDNFKTLQELAAWLEEHPESAAAMNEAIGANTTAITAVNTRIDNLDYTDAAVAKQYVSEVDQTDGVISVKRANLLDVCDEKGAAAGALTSAKAYTDQLANGQVSANTTAIATNTSDITTIKGQITTINTTIEENELVTASALTNLDERLTELSSAAVTSVTGSNYITASTTDGAVVVTATTGAVANGGDTLVVASDVKSYVDNMMSWGEF